MTTLSSIFLLVNVSTASGTLPVRIVWAGGGAGIPSFPSTKVGA